MQAGWSDVRGGHDLGKVAGKVTAIVAYRCGGAGELNADRIAAVGAVGGASPPLDRARADQAVGVEDFADHQHRECEPIDVAEARGEPILEVARDERLGFTGGVPALEQRAIRAAG